jgi:uncharacterized protein (UPF0333 family)
MVKINKIIRNLKSQAAMEFLMTYGWAILVVLVAIGALAYFGVLSPDKFLPSKCVLPSGIACVDHRADATGITLVLQNGMGYDLTNVIVNVVGCGVLGPSDTTFDNGEQKTFNRTCTLTGSKFNGDIKIFYNVTDTGLTHNITGSVTTKIEK